MKATSRLTAASANQLLELAHRLSEQLRALASPKLGAKESGGRLVLANRRRGEMVQTGQRLDHGRELSDCFN